MLTLTKAFSEKINISLQKFESFEENIEILTELFKKKIKISDEISKIIRIANLLKDADNLDSINRLLVNFPSYYFIIDKWEYIDIKNILKIRVK